MKWLPDHIQYAYKIWTQSDQWFLRYKRKCDLTFDLHLHNQDGRISTWSYYSIHFSSGQRYCENLKMIAHSVFEISSTQNSWDLTFDLHLHSQDGLMSICCYYVIWLADHTAYAYKIWARLDQWLLKYNTKRGLTFDLHLHSQDGLMSTWCYYVIWLADHITYAYKIWARFDQWFLRYKTKGMCVWACVRVCDIQRWEWVKICMCGHTFA